MEKTTTWRLALGLSIIWVLTAYFLTEQSAEMRWFLLFGVLPVIVGWIIRWVYLGYKKDQSRNEKPYRFRLTWWK